MLAKIALVTALLFGMGTGVANAAPKPRPTPLTCALSPYPGLPGFLEVHLTGLIPAQEHNYQVVIAQPPNYSTEIYIGIAFAPATSFNFPVQVTGGPGIYVGGVFLSGIFKTFCPPTVI